MAKKKLSPEYEAYIASSEWQAKREGALERAGHRCQVCNTEKRLDVHHRTYERFKHEEPGDLTVLCRTCHDLYHGSKDKPKRQRRKRARGKRRQRTTRGNPILAFMEPGRTYTTREIAQGAGITCPQAGGRLGGMVKSGVVCRPAKGRWELAVSKRPVEPLPPKKVSDREANIQALAKQIRERAVERRKQKQLPPERMAVRTERYGGYLAKRCFD